MYEHYAYISSVQFTTYGKQNKILEKNSISIVASFQLNINIIVCKIQTQNKRYIINASNVIREKYSPFVKHCKRKNKGSCGICYKE